jgi:hypothetical protein
MFCFVFALICRTSSRFSTRGQFFIQRQRLFCFRFGAGGSHTYARLDGHEACDSGSASSQMNLRQHAVRRRTLFEGPPLCCRTFNKFIDTWSCSWATAIRWNAQKQILWEVLSEETSRKKILRPHSLIE